MQINHYKNWNFFQVFIFLSKNHRKHYYTNELTGFRNRKLNAKNGISITHGWFCFSILWRQLNSNLIEMPKKFFILKLFDTSPFELLKSTLQVRWCILYIGVLCRIQCHLLPRHLTDVMVVYLQKWYLLGRNSCSYWKLPVHVIL